MEIDEELLDPYQYNELEDAVKHLERLEATSPEYSIFRGRLGERLKSELDKDSYAEICGYLQNEDFGQTYEALEQ